MSEKLIPTGEITSAAPTATDSSTEEASLARLNDVAELREALAGHLGATVPADSEDFRTLESRKMSVQEISAHLSSTLFEELKRQSIQSLRDPIFYLLVLLPLLDGLANGNSDAFVFSFVMTILLKANDLRKSKLYRTLDISSPARRQLILHTSDPFALVETRALGVIRRIPSTLEDSSAEPAVAAVNFMDELAAQAPSSARLQSFRSTFDARQDESE